MAENNWTQRLGESAPLPKLHDIQATVEELAEQTSHTPGRTGMAIQNVASVVLIGTGLVSGALGLVHLSKAFSSPHTANHPDRNTSQQTHHRAGRHGHG